MEDFKDKFKGINSTEILKFVVITNYFDTLKEVAAKSHTNTIFMNHSPGSVDEVYQRLTSTLIASGVAGRFEVPPDDGAVERSPAAAAGSYVSDGG